MIKSRLAALAALMLFSAGLAPSIAVAQNGPMLTRPSVSARNTENETRGEREAREARERSGQEAEAAPPPDPAKIKTDAQAALTAAGNGCQVSEATLLGQTAEAAQMFEVACASGPGFIVVASTPANIVDCTLLASQAQTARERDPNADVGRQCVMPANQNASSVFAGYAREAAVPCAVDEGIAIGRTPDGKTIYEVGCAGADGYWIEQTGAAWTKTPCIEVVSRGQQCRFTTPAEQNATIQALVTETPGAADCNIEQIRYMGGNAGGKFVEIKCAAGTGNGYVLRVLDNAVTASYRCAIAKPIGGGCTLTPEAQWLAGEEEEDAGDGQ